MSTIRRRITIINPNKLNVTDFVNKFIDDYEKFESMGYEKNQIFRFLGTLQYVQDFSDTPQWLETAEKLPKGYKWKDGEKYKFCHRSGKYYNDSFTNVLLEVEDDLWIKDGIRGVVFLPNTNGDLDSNGNVSIVPFRAKPKIAIVRDWKNLCINDIERKLWNSDQELCDCLCWYYQKKGMRFHKSILRSLSRND